MNRLLVAAVLGMTMIAGCSKSEDKGASHTANLPEMSLDEVEKGLGANTLTAVDCNGDRTRKKYGAVPGAILTSEEDFPASELPADKSRKLVFYCSDPG